jgi:serine/threonine protein kinase
MDVMISMWGGQQYFAILDAMESMMSGQPPEETNPIFPPIEDLYGDILGAGAVLGPYVVDALAMEGGFAAVYRAHHLQTGDHVALKVLRRSLASSVRMVERFHQEAKVVQRIRHPNIVQILDFDMNTPWRPYIVMEWLDGGSLAEELGIRGSFAVQEALDLVGQIGEALMQAHAIGVVHRDLKAGNIMLLPRGGWFQVKLIDFGIAKFLGARDRHSVMTTHTIIGTPETMAPEQILNQEIDARTDIYALGLLLYQLVCGRLPFVGEHLIDVEQMHLYAPPPKASERAPVVPRFDAVVARALQKRKEDRYANVTEFLAALQESIASTVKPSLAPVQHTERGLGMYVEIQVMHIDVLSDDVAEQRLMEMAGTIEEIFGRVEELMDASGLTHDIFETNTALLGIGRLGEDASVAHETNVRLFQAALVRHSHWSKQFGGGQELCVCITVHTDEIIVDGEAAEARIRDGRLLSLHEWPSRPMAHGVFASASVAAGLDDYFRLTPVTDYPDVLRIESLP